MGKVDTNHKNGRPHYFLDFNEFERLAYKLLKDIKGTGKIYNGILCPLRGGFYLSYFMSRHLQVPMYYIQISSRNGREQMDFQVGLRHDLDGELFLLCDDIYDSGMTIQKIHALYSDVRFDNLCLVSKVRNADFLYGTYVEHDVWVDFFWEVM